MTRELQRSATTKDCQFCVMLYQGIHHVYKGTQLPEGFHLWRNEDAGLGGPLLWFTPINQNGEYSAFHSTPDNDRFECHVIGPSHAISGDAASEQCLLFAQLQIADCLENHSQCARPISQQTGSEGNTRRLRRGARDLSGKRPQVQLPRRLLDVGSPESTHIRLLETDHTTDPQARYACLSHCWGESQPLTTETSTLEARKAGIVWNALPKTFQDAADFTRRLGLRYLWIDSLCIMQDSKEDWRRESSRMASIYENCFVCLAATASPNYQGGLYFQQPNRGVSTKVSDLVEDGETYDIFVRGALKHPDMNRMFTTDTPDIEDGFPLLQRAWVFQEMLLAPRIVHFWENELYFQCMESYVCECGALMRDGLSKASHFEALCGTDPFELQDRWREMVNSYSKLRLTYPSDKLPAVAGLAKQMGRFRKGKYLAGLWSDSLLDDLCWKMTSATTGKPTEPGDSESYIAPSWSWASALGPVRYSGDITDQRRNNKFVADARVLKVEVNNVDKHDPTGQVISGFMRLLARTWTKTNPDWQTKQARKAQGLEPESSNQGLYYVLLGVDESDSHWLVLERVGFEGLVGPEQYQRKDYIEIFYAKNMIKNLEKGRKVFTIV